MAKKKLNFNNFQKYIANNKAIQKQVREIVDTKLIASKNKLINDFLSHPVSSEISAGANGGNSSRTLGGYGNLFSFIGFTQGDNPIDKWKNFLQTVILLDGKIKTSVSAGNIYFSFKISSISEGDLRSQAPMPWEGGRSWIQAIERGISGFSFYISEKNKGRSGGGLQSKNQKKSSGSYSPVPYWSDMWSRFIKDIAS